MVPALNTRICWPRTGAAACTSCTVDSAVVLLLGLTRRRRGPPWAPFRAGSPSRFAASSAVKNIHPCCVTAWPVEAGDQSELDRVLGEPNTIGMVEVAAFAARAARVLAPRRSRSPCGEPGRPPALDTGQRDLPPSGIRSRRSGPRRSRFLSGPAGTRPHCGRRSIDAAPRNPITGIAGCCPRAPSGHAAAAPPSVNMNSRRLM